MACLLTAPQCHGLERIRFPALSVTRCFFVGHRTHYRLCGHQLLLLTNERDRAPGFSAPPSLKLCFCLSPGHTGGWEGCHSASSCAVCAHIFTPFGVRLLLFLFVCLMFFLPIRCSLPFVKSKTGHQRWCPENTPESLTSCHAGLPDGLDVTLGGRAEDNLVGTSATRRVPPAPRSCGKPGAPIRDPKSQRWSHDHLAPL